MLTSSSCPHRRLSAAVGRPDKTRVAPNLIDASLYRVYQHAGPLRVLWTGSACHHADLQIIEGVVAQLAADYGERVVFLFFGYLPDGLARCYRVPGEGFARLRPSLPNVGFVGPVPLDAYPATLCQLAPDVAMCPLSDSDFSRCKSPVKWFETSLAGAATLATGIPPFCHVIEDGKTGLLVREDQWADGLRVLIEDDKLRKELALAARQEVLERHSWQSEARRAWLDVFRSIAVQRSPAFLVSA